MNHRPQGETFDETNGEPESCLLECGEWSLEQISSPRREFLGDGTYKETVRVKLFLIFFVAVIRSSESFRPSNLTPTPHLGRDRFKLQHEFLSHKWLTLKLRREDRIEESEAKFQLAKTLEAQLDDYAKPFIDGAKPIDDVGVEDFLDPQLLFALKEIGFEDDSTAKGLEKPEPIKSVGNKGENSSRERIRLEAQIKAEKVKAINLNRAGK
ncbi:hypothetical protein LOK49_LG09G01730 [Camellia lanceoleosa]|uniref:Uncharacterized protein n=1 Tax=Camellia lanceoleosa TaxID=1840588 RepID=A0ACC0GF52_9ERIC|nr:hypothetical protein LOK49_LG09G01730 [Camellia lanceoleosa]